MASVAKRPNGGKMIQFFDATGKRRAIQIGKLSKKAATSVRVHVERLVSSRITGHALDDGTALWLSKLDKTMIDK